MGTIRNKVEEARPFFSKTTEIKASFTDAGTVLKLEIRRKSPIVRSVGAKNHPRARVMVDEKAQRFRPSPPWRQQ